MTRSIIMSLPVPLGILARHALTIGDPAIGVLLAIAAVAVDLWGYVKWTKR